MNARAKLVGTMRAESKSVVRAVLFDLYGTLVYVADRDYQLKLLRVGKLCGVSASGFQQAWGATAQPSMLGQFSNTRERVEAVLSLLGVQRSGDLAGVIARREHEFLRLHTRVYRDVWNSLGKIKALGFRLGLVSNASASVRETLRARRLARLFDVVALSCDLGVRKPAAEIYLAALDELCVAPGFALFVGDGADRELEGAKKLGMTTIRIRRDEGPRGCHAAEFAPASDYVVHSLTEIPKLVAVIWPRGERASISHFPTCRRPADSA